MRADSVNILMVDDQPGKLLTYEAILGELDENLIKATSGREALDCLLKTEVAVVLMDVSMPEMDGFELAGMIRQHPRFQHTAIIFISALSLVAMMLASCNSIPSAFAPDETATTGAARQTNETPPERSAEDSVNSIGGGTLLTVSCD